MERYEMDNDDGDGEDGGEDEDGWSVDDMGGRGGGGMVHESEGVGWRGGGIGGLERIIAMRFVIVVRMIMTAITVVIRAKKV